MLTRWQEGLSDTCHLRDKCNNHCPLAASPHNCQLESQAFQQTAKFCICFYFPFLRTWNTLPFSCNHILRKTVGKPQAAMWNKCRTGVWTKKRAVLKPCPANLSRWCEWVRQVGGQPGGGGWPPSHSPVSWVSAPGGQGHSQGGVGRSAHQMTSHPSIDLFIVVLVALLTRGNWALSFAHVPEFAVI